MRVKIPDKFRRFFFHLNHATTDKISGQLLHFPFDFFLFKYLLQHFDFFGLLFSLEQLFRQLLQALCLAISKLGSLEFMAVVTLHPQWRQTTHPIFKIFSQFGHCPIVIPSMPCLVHPKSFRYT